jgi:hypothetical protein
MARCVIWLPIYYLLARASRRFYSTADRNHGAVIVHQQLVGRRMILLLFHDPMLNGDSDLLARRPTAQEMLQVELASRKEHLCQFHDFIQRLAQQRSAFANNEMTIPARGGISCEQTL